MKQQCLTLPRFFMIVTLIFAAERLQADRSSWLPAALTRQQQQQETKKIPFSKQGTIVVQQVRGPVTVETWSRPTATLHTTKKARSPEELAALVTSLDKERAQTTINLQQPDKSSTIETTLFVPDTASVEVAITQQGDITVKNSPHKLSLYTKQGKISAQSTRDSIVRARTEQGSIHMTCTVFPATSSLLLTAPYGGVTVTLPINANARLDAASQRGPINSHDIAITVDPYTMTLTKESWKKIAKHVQGTLGDGGGPITIEAFGRVTLEALK